MLRELARFFRKRSSRRLNVFLGCLFIATIIWLLIALSKEYRTEFVFPIEHRNLPEDRVPEDPVNDEVTLDIRSHGFQLLAYKLFSRKEPIELNLERLRYKDPDERLHGFLATDELLEELSRQFPEQTKVRNVRPDTLHLHFTPKTEKEVPVSPQLELDFKGQYRLDGEPELEPSTITLRGPASILDTVEEARTELLSLSDVQADRKEKVRVDTEGISKRIEAEPNSVSIHLRVDEFTEGSVTVPLKAKGVPKGHMLKTYPDSVRIDHLVSFGNYDKVKASMFEAIVEVPARKELKERQHLRVRITDHPSFVELARHEPQRVEFIIRKEK